MNTLKYQICEKEIYFNKKTERFTENNFHAGGKAPSDIYKIALNMGYKPLYINRVFGKDFFSLFIRKIYNLDWLKLFFKVKNHSILLIQLPIRWGNLKIRYIFLNLLHKIKKVQIVGLIHDIEPLRYDISDNNNGCIKDFLHSLKYCHFIIVHNNRMKTYLEQFNYPSDHIIELKIFDYLTQTTSKEIFFSKKVNFAGNLSNKKSPFLGQLKKTNIEYNLYGINYDKETIESKNIHYMGSFESDVLPTKIDNGFGLIWDGEELTTCSGNTGNYLRWNNPHKLSLYIVSGIPVFIWKHAAEAKFVEDHKIGYTIDTIYDIEKILDNISEAEYLSLIKNVNIISNQLTQGFYTKHALEIIQESVIHK